ncbi:unnamed protein product [Dibothriocephalus latus]|uniref:Pre-mRNA-splicing factor 38 n=1 Tax=Dibothriocephalus latus TaxID=60516 RepID=A0A3P6PY29_DIBLA|nr:unnamed protein product [Dibothriocephalus latus]
MANRTVKDAHSVHGTNPQYLIEKIIRSRIYESKYWKEHCFALTAELLVDKAIELRYIGGVYSGLTKPTPFLCLVLKMLQIQPDKDIVIEFIKQEDYKYARAIGAFYLRLVGESAEIYKYLETLYNDFRKIKKQDSSGKFSLIHMDEFIDSLLTEERVCDVILPRLQKRSVLEEANILESRQSLLDEDLEDLQYNEELDDIPDSDADTAKEKHKGRKHEDDRDYRERSKDRERARERNHRRSRDESPHLNHRDRRDRERDYDKERRKDKEDKERREKDKSRRLVNNF